VQWALARAPQRAGAAPETANPNGNPP